MARAEKAGQWAVNQAANDRGLQKRAVARRRPTRTATAAASDTTSATSRQVGRRAFYLQDGQWVDAEEAGTRKTRVVKLFSPEYFELLKNDATFARLSSSAGPCRSTSATNASSSRRTASRRTRSSRSVRSQCEDEPG